MRDGVRTQMDATCITQWLDAAVVRNHVTELNDFRNAPEVFDKTRSPPERLAREIVDGDLSVVEVGVRNVTQILKNEVLNCAQVLANGGRTDLFMVADDEDGLAQIQGDKSHHI